MPLNVFYLDDEEALGENFADFFSSDEIKVTAFTAASAAIERIHADPPDLFFVDYRLQGITGDKVAVQLPVDIPKYMITGDMSVETVYKFIKVFNKPFRIEDIQAVLDEHLKLKNSK